MLRLNEKYRRSVGPFFLLAFLCFNSNIRSQVPTGYDTLNLINPDESADPREIRPFFISDINLMIPDIPLPSGIISSDKAPLFYDSLKAKASRKLITKKLYDILIVSHEPSSRKEISGSSEASYKIFSGRKIRNIEVRRLGVFGSSITMPLSSSPDKIEKLLNATHVNTNEHIIRKNLLFSEGDTLSPLILSDNERILRQLPYIDDSRIIVIPVSDEDVDIVVVTKDIYSLGASFKYSSITKGSVSLFEKNIFGMGHEFRINMPYDSDLPDSPGFGVEYNIDNIARSFTNIGLYYFDGLGKKTYGINLDRRLVSSTTRYAFGISIRKMYTTEDLDTLPEPVPLKYNLQDYWFSRSFLLNKESVSRLILGARFTNNDVWNHPFILPESYHQLQKYRMYLVSAAFTFQKYYKTNLIYGYGRTEDIPYGGLINLIAGKEYSEFKQRIYAGAEISLGQSIKSIGYFYASAGISTFFNDDHTEQGLFLLRTSFISNLSYLGRYRIRNFIKADYTRGFDRYYDEDLTFTRADGFTGFSNDSVGGRQRLAVNLESVLFSPVNFYGFRFAFFGFADLGFLFGTNEFVQQGEVLSSIGLGIRIRNDNFVFNTLQVRLGYFPNLPDYSRVNYILVSGEQLLKPDIFDPGPPSLLPYE
ncbi:MAG: hypothetical protein A2V50_07205 [Bacteroidetes bacterium RBG_19FT_COMBO_42_10]|nr:MAG: hypothetical protein A2V50_07205 [Bacteroidetes bacterium RBG_19FT_COMBO_42_10]